MSERFYLASRRGTEPMVSWVEDNIGGFLPLRPWCEDTWTNKFDWGNDGIGCRLLASSLLCDALDDYTRASYLTPTFVVQVLRKIQCDHWNLSRSKIRTWAEKIEAQDFGDQQKG